MDFSFRALSLTRLADQLRGVTGPRIGAARIATIWTIISHVAQVVPLSRWNNNELPCRQNGVCIGMATDQPFGLPQVCLTTSLCFRSFSYFPASCLQAEGSYTPCRLTTFDHMA
jgi:hypothetical protein